jgi:hypothetical protein
VAQQCLFVLAIQQDDFHDQILVSANQCCHVGMPLALCAIQPVPSKTYLLEFLVRLLESWKQAFSSLGKPRRIEFRRALEGAVFALDEGQEFARQIKMFVQDAERFGGI